MFGTVEKIIITLVTNYKVSENKKMESVKFIHKITGVVKTQIPIMELGQYEKLDEYLAREAIKREQINEVTNWQLYPDYIKD